MSDEVMPPPMFDVPDNESTEDKVKRNLNAINVIRARNKERLDELREMLPVDYVDGYLWTNHGRFVGIVKLDYSVLDVHKCPSGIMAAGFAFNRSVLTGKLGAAARDLAGHVLFVPSPPWGGPVMVK